MGEKSLGRVGTRLSGRRSKGEGGKVKDVRERKEGNGGRGGEGVSQEANILVLG